MRACWFSVLSCWLVGVAGLASATDVEEIVRSLTMTCEYADYGSWQDEAVVIVQTDTILSTAKTLGDLAGVRAFSRGGNPKQIFLVRPGQLAECSYPSGTRVRVKVGQGEARAYGQCGGDPEVFMSLWVNERKLASRVWFAGHCRYDFDQEAPAVSFRVTGPRRDLRVEKCHSLWPREGASVPAPGAPRQAVPKELSVCVDFPEVANFPRDLLEYPPQGTRVPKTGEIELVSGADAVCLAVRNELAVDFYGLRNQAGPHATPLVRPEWRDTSVALSKELAGSREAIFDFDNDGRLDRVFSNGYTSNYMDGSTLLVQPGWSASTLEVPDAPLDRDSRFLPCQMGTEPYAIRDCPPFSQKGDDSGFAMTGRRGDDPLYFRARYATVSPFRFQNTTFLGVSSVSSDTQDYVAVLKPLPNGKYQDVCLLRRTPENF